MHLSRQRNDWAGLVLGHYSAGSSLLFAGELVLSRSHLEQALALYAPAPQRLFGQASRRSPANDSTVVLGNCPFLGYPEQGLTCIGAAIAEGPKLSHPPSLATALGLGCKLLPFDRDNEVLEEWVGEMVAIITDQALPHRRAGTTIYCGWRKSKMAM
jgi:hypothetical protein